MEWFEWLTQDYWQALEQPQAWAGLIGRIIAAAVTMLAVFIAAYLAYRYTLKNNKISHNTEIHVDRLKREVEALENVWTLLAYMSDKKSIYAIIHWQKDRETEGGKRYFVHFKNLEYFCLKAVNEVFYQKHAGLFLSGAIRDKLYEYRNGVGMLYFAHKDDKTYPEDWLIPIRNPEKALALIKCYEELNVMLRSAMEARYKAMSV